MALTEREAQEIGCWVMLLSFLAAVGLVLWVIVHFLAKVW